MVDAIQLQPAEAATTNQLGHRLMEVHAEARVRRLPDGSTPLAAVVDGRLATLRARLRQIQDGPNPTADAASRRALIEAELAEQTRWLEMPVDRVGAALAALTAPQPAPILAPGPNDPTRALVTRLRDLGARLSLADDGHSVRVTGSDLIAKPDLRALQTNLVNVVDLLVLEARGVLVLRPRTATA